MMLVPSVLLSVILFSAGVNCVLNPCAGAKTCSMCMKKGNGCAWCPSPDFKDGTRGPETRCAQSDDLKKRGCSNVVDIKNSNDTIRNEPAVETEKKVIQLSPQEMVLKLRPNTPYTMKISFSQARNYPVDLYYLTDLSYSMEKHLSMVSSQAKTISKRMKTITSKFRMGFGAFVDKPVFPFIDPRKSYMKNPCAVASETTKECDPTFGYKHILSLTDDMSAFSRTINSTRPSGNIDALEGGLDALLQAALCDEIIGWDKNARKIVLFTTDTGFHMAGDGKLAGLVERYEERCAMGKRNKSGPYFYLKSTKLDYPSVGQVARVLEKQGISVIFAILKNMKTLYDNFGKVLPSATVGILDSDSSNVVQLIKENYDKISSTVTLNVEDVEDFNYILKTRCPGGQFKEGKTCSNLPLGGRIDYELTLEVGKCIEGTKQIVVRPSHLKEEALLINVSTVCSCDKCEAESQQKDSPLCSSKGDLLCGACKCTEKRHGDFCECSSTDADASNKGCLNPADGSICSGRGRCECGRCKCNAPRYNGSLCECDLMACPRASDDNKVCGGPKRGRCHCNGSCVCNPAFHKEACDCLTSNEQCMAGNVTCSNRGTCDCGYCVCDLNYVGLTCGVLWGSAGPLCNNEQVQQCVECLHKKATDTEQQRNCTDVCSKSKYIDEAKVTVEDTRKGDMTNLCILYDARECRIFYAYRWEDRVYSNRKAYIRIQRESQCPSRVSAFAIVGGVIAGIVVIGLLLLIIWKAVVTISDKQEVAKFQKELDNAKWEMEENPIFKEPVTTVNNPLYNAHAD